MRVLRRKGTKRKMFHSCGTLITMFMRHIDESGVGKNEPICARCYPKAAIMLTRAKSKFPDGLPQIKIAEIMNCMKIEDSARPVVFVPVQNVNVPNANDRSKDEMKRDLISKLKSAHKKNAEKNENNN